MIGFNLNNNSIYPTNIILHSGDINRLGEISYHNSDNLQINY